MERVEGHSGAAYIVTREISTKECPWLEGHVNGDVIPEDTLLHPFYGATYGCISPAGVAISLRPGQGPFFEVPRDALRIVGVD